MKRVELFLLPVTGAGHLASMVEMASRLLLHGHNALSITVLLVTTPAPRDSLVCKADVASLSSSVAGDIRFEELGISEDSPLFQECIESNIVSSYMEIHKPLVKAAISQLLSSSAATAAALVIDFLATTMIDVAVEIGIPTYLYYTARAGTLALMLQTPTLHEMQKIPLDVDGDKGREMELPGLSPIPVHSMPVFMFENPKDIYEWIQYHGRRFPETKGMIVNTFAEIEPTELEALNNGVCVQDRPTPPIYPVGPVLKLQDSNRGGVERHECIKWLDEQPPGSVVFLCFGSTGVFASPQLKEMAMGLERCGHRFLWMVRCSTTEGSVEDVLPEGFLERTKTRGLVWPSWVPQVEILSHKAVGGFATHCGWNSCLESLWFGVPMLAWPLVLDQHFNAYHLVKDAGVAVEIRVDRFNGNYVTAEEFARGIKCLMEDSEEGKKVRRRVQEMKVTSRRAVEKGGSSYNSLEKFVLELTRG